mgnify:CR=1 FL=1
MYISQNFLQIENTCSGAATEFNFSGGFSCFASPCRRLRQFDNLFDVCSGSPIAYKNGPFPQNIVGGTAQIEVAQWRPVANERHPYHWKPYIGRRLLKTNILKNRRHCSHTITYKHIHTRILTLYWNLSGGFVEVTRWRTLRGISLDI